jgi:signal transduction histidine kinase
VRVNNRPQIRWSSTLAFKPLLAILTSLNVAIVMVFFVIGIGMSHRNAMRIAGDSLENLSTTMASEMGTSLGQIAFTFETLDLWLMLHPDADLQANEEFLKYVNTFRSSMSNRVELGLLSADGILRIIPYWGHKGQPLDVREDEIFLIQNNQYTRRTIIGSTMRDSLGEWKIPISSPISVHRKDAIAFVALMSLEGLQGHFNAFKPTAGGAIDLLRYDGEILARVPFDEKYLAMHLEVPSSMQGNGDEASISATIREGKGVDGLDRILAFTPIPGSGLMITVSATRSEILKPWRQELPPETFLAAVLVGLLIYISNRLFSILSELDMTRKNLESSVMRLEENRAAKDKLFSIVSHDLRGPIGGIKSLLETLAAEHRDMSEEELDESLEALGEAANRSYNLLDDLLTWSRSQRGLLPFAPTRFVLRPVADECAASLIAQAMAKGVEIGVDMEDGTAVYADEKMLVTALRNLLSNAVKYSRPGGKIIIGASKGEGGTTITVTDEGAGIDEEGIATLFNLGALHSRPGTAGELGTGIGLTVVKDFMDRHGGKIEVRSKVGSGTTFALFFPEAAPPSSAH